MRNGRPSSHSRQPSQPFLSRSPAAAQPTLRESKSYTAAQMAIRAFLFQGLRCRTEGSDHVPTHGHAILACNHLSYWDAPFIASAVERPIRFLTKADIFQIPVLSSALRATGAIPVRRGRLDRKALTAALEHLEGGGLVGIFPEGTCNPYRLMLPPFAGAAWLAMRAQAPVVPVAVTGLRDFPWLNGWRHPFGAVLRFGRPLRFDRPAYPAPQRLWRTLATTHIVDAIRSLIRDA